MSMNTEDLPYCLCLRIIDFIAAVYIAVSSGQRRIQFNLRIIIQKVKENGSGQNQKQNRKTTSN